MGEHCTSLHCNKCSAILHCTEIQCSVIMCHCMQVDCVMRTDSSGRAVDRGEDHRCPHILHSPVEGIIQGRLDEIEEQQKTHVGRNVHMLSEWPPPNSRDCPKQRAGIHSALHYTVKATNAECTSLPAADDAESAWQCKYAVLVHTVPPRLRMYSTEECPSQQLTPVH